MYTCIVALSLIWGPGNFRKESTYRVNLTNIAEIKIVSRSIRIFGEKLVLFRLKHSAFFNFYVTTNNCFWKIHILFEVYGTKNKKGNLLDKNCDSVANGSIKNPTQQSKTILQLADKVNSEGT